MSRDSDRILDECVDRISCSESIEQCLASHPEQAEDLEPPLRAMFDILAAYSLAPRPNGKVAEKQCFRATLDSLERKRQEHCLTISGLFRYVSVRLILNES